MQSSNQPTKINRPFADTGTKNTIPELQSGTSVANQASFEKGFPPATMTPASSGGLPPLGQDVNGVLNAISSVARWSQSGGGYTYDSSFSSSSAVGGYPKGSMLLKASLDGYWLNASENNTTNPDSGGANWTELVPFTKREVVDYSSVNIISKSGYYGFNTGLGSSSIVQHIQYEGTSTYAFQLDIPYESASYDLRFRNKTDGISWSGWSTFWTTQNFNPANYLPLSGGGLSGNLSVSGYISSFDFVNYGSYLFGESVNDTGWTHPSDGYIYQKNNGVTSWTHTSTDSACYTKLHFVTQPATESSDLGATTQHVTDKINNLFPSGPGWQKYPNGTIEQWGALIVGDVPAGNLSGTWTFPIPFPAVCANIQATVVDAAGGYHVVVNTSHPNTTYVEWFLNETHAIAQNVIINFRVIGR